MLLATALSATAGMAAGFTTTLSGKTIQLPDMPTEITPGSMYAIPDGAILDNDTTGGISADVDPAFALVCRFVLTPRSTSLMLTFSFKAARQLDIVDPTSRRLITDSWQSANRLAFNCRLVSICLLGSRSSTGHVIVSSEF